MKKIYSSLLLGLVSSVANAANFTNATGFVTPHELTVPFRSLCLITAAGECTSIWSGTQDLTFKRSDANVSPVLLSQVSVPVGRYFGITAGYAHGWQVKLNGAKYMGKTGTIANGNQLWSIGTSAMTGGSVQTTSTGSPTTMGSLDELGVITGSIGGSVYSTSVMWSTPICVTENAADTNARCQTGDVRVAPDSTDTTSGGVVFKSATLNAVMDLTHAVAVDSSNSALALAGQYPYIDFGDISALVHMAAAAGPSSRSARRCHRFSSPTTAPARDSCNSRSRPKPMLVA